MIYQTREYRFYISHGQLVVVHRVSGALENSPGLIPRSLKSCDYQGLFNAAKQYLLGGKSVKT